MRYFRFQLPSVFLLSACCALSACGNLHDGDEGNLGDTLLLPETLSSGLSVKAQPISWRAHPSLCLGTQNASRDNGTRVEVQTCSGAENQQWTFAGGHVKIFGNKCLDVKDGTVKRGTRLQIWDCTANNFNQRWSAPESQLTWTGHSLCADVVDGVATSGQPLQIWRCDTANINQQFVASVVTPSKTGSSGSAGSTGSSTGSQASPAAGTTINGMLQGGSGWPGDINKASTSAQYHGLTLDELKARKSEMARELAKHPDVEAAIRQVSQATGVPDGLLAGVAYQESSFIKTSKSNNPNPSPGDTQDVGLMQCPLEDFKGSSWQDPVTNITLFVNKYFLPAYKQNKSWGMALRIWNTGEGRASDLSYQNNNTDSNYIKEILGTHCMGLD